MNMHLVENEFWIPAVKYVIEIQGFQHLSVVGHTCSPPPFPHGTVSHDM